jgi:ADP-heptose:LPS heptosyltransferase
MYDGVEIHYLTKAKFRSLVDVNPYITKVHAIEKSTNEVIDVLVAEQFDYVIDLHKNLRSARVKRKLRMLSFAFEKLNWQKWLLVNFGINRMPSEHIVDRYMATLKAFGIKNDNKGLDFFWSEKGKEEKLALPESHLNGYIGVGIGAAHWRKKLRLSQYIEMCRNLNYPVVLLGGPSESTEGEKIAAECGALVYNSAGKCSLEVSATIIKECELLITPDTGIMHIAAALKKPIISIWGATVPEFGMYPYQNEALNEMVQAEHLKKRPCSKLGTKCKYKPCKCIDELPLNKIVETAISQIKPLAQ